MKSKELMHAINRHIKTRAHAHTNFYNAIVGQQNVAGLDVAVNDFVFAVMQIAQPSHRLTHNVANLRQQQQHTT